jgi:hypothetical protein
MVARLRCCPAGTEWEEELRRPSDVLPLVSEFTVQNLIGCLGTSRIRIGMWDSKAKAYVRNFGTGTNPRRASEFEMRCPRRNTDTWDRESTLAEKIHKAWCRVKISWVPYSVHNNTFTSCRMGK